MSFVTTYIDFAETEEKKKILTVITAEPGERKHKNKERERKKNAVEKHMRNVTAFSVLYNAQRSRGKTIVLSGYAFDFLVLV